MLVKKITFIYI